MQMTLAQPGGEWKLPIEDVTISGVADGENTASPKPAESLRHCRKPDKMPTAKTLNATAIASDIEIRLQILQQAIKDFAAVAEPSSVQIAALPQRESVAVVLIGVGHCRVCGTLFNGFSEGCPTCGTTASH